MRPVLLVAVLASACGGTSPVQPSAGAVATIRVADETFRVNLVTADQVASARRAQAGGPGGIPNGRIVNGTEVNSPWSWHLEDVAFVDVAIEICDGRPSQVERIGVSFGGGRFCPWSAVVVRVDP